MAANEPLQPLRLAKKLGVVVAWQNQGFRIFEDIVSGRPLAMKMEGKQGDVLGELDAEKLGRRQEPGVGLDDEALCGRLDPHLSPPEIPGPIANLELLLNPCDARGVVIGPEQFGVQAGPLMCRERKFLVHGVQYNDNKMKEKMKYRSAFRLRREGLRVIVSA
jgi:hypothetical protein